MYARPNTIKQRPYFTGQLAFRLIDVERKCLVEWRGKPPRCTAQSYNIKGYSRRGLSYSSNILSAFTGPLSFIEQKSSLTSSSLYPPDTLAMIFFSTPGGCFATISKPDVNLIRFPTWSWVSWKRNIDMADEPRCNCYDTVENRLPCDGVKCYVLEVDSQGRNGLRPQRLRWVAIPKRLSKDGRGHV